MLSLLNIDYSSLMGTLPLNSGSSDSLNSFINNGFLGLITEADTTYKIVGSVIALVFALLGCFFGYKLSKVFMSITGFIIGLFIGQTVSSQLLHIEGFASVLCITLGGAVIAALALWIYRIGIFILCFPCLWQSKRKKKGRSGTDHQWVWDKAEDEPEYPDRRLR